MELATEQIELAIPVLEEADRALSGGAYRDLLMTAYTNAFWQLGVQNIGSWKAGMAEYNTIRTAFSNDLMNIYSGFEKGTYSVDQAMKMFKDSCGKRYVEFFRAGTKAIGNPYYQEMGLTKKDLAFISSARRSESRYFKNFLKDIADPMHKPADWLLQRYDTLADAKAAGYRVQQWDYKNRVGLYGDSGKSLFMDGMVAGTGDKVQIRWVLGVPKEKHCVDCPQLARKTYTWKTLPTVPRGGGTACLFACLCHLEYITPDRGRELDIPGRGTIRGLTAPGRYARVFDAMGAEVGGQLRNNVEDIYKRMYKARQMVHITLGDEQQEWIKARRTLNQQLVDMLSGTEYRAVPTQSVSDLIMAVDEAVASGATLGTIAATDILRGKE